VWDGEQTANGAGWARADEPGTATIKPQDAEVHGGAVALEFRYRGEKYQGAGWNWMSFARNAGTDISRKENLSFWIKSRGSKPSGELQVNLVCATATPPHHHSDHTEKVLVSRYCPDLLDGQWHEVVVPMKDFARPDTFDLTKAFEIQFALHPAQAVDGSFFIDDIAFDDGRGDTQPAAAASAKTQGAAFSWSSDGSGEDTFVNSHHPVIPGHYEFVPDPTDTGTVFRGRLTDDFENDDSESVHLHPDVYFDEFRPGSFTVSFDVRVEDLRPDVLGPCRDKPWLNVVTMFDRTKLTGDTTFAPSSMRVRTWQDGVLVSEGPYKGRPGLAGVHMGLYVNRQMKVATVYNRRCEISVRPISGTRTILDFFRGLDDRLLPSVAFSEDDGETWCAGSVVVNVPPSVRRHPSVKYASDGRAGVHLVYTEDHPRDFDNSLYHVVVRDGLILDSRGQRLATLAEGLPAPERGTRIFQGDPANVAWPADLDLDEEGDRWSRSPSRRTRGDCLPVRGARTTGTASAGGTASDGTWPRWCSRARGSTRARTTTPAASPSHRASRGGRPVDERGSGDGAAPRQLAGRATALRDLPRHAGGAGVGVALRASDPRLYRRRRAPHRAGRPAGPRCGALAARALPFLHQLLARGRGPAALRQRTAVPDPTTTVEQKLSPGRAARHPHARVGPSAARSPGRPDLNSRSRNGLRSSALEKVSWRP
jgi:hypothetical protein